MEPMDTDVLYILDSTVFLEKYGVSFADMCCATVPEVVEEIKNPFSQIYFDMLVKSGLSVMSASAGGLKYASSKVKETGDKLSATDIAVLALALDFFWKQKKVAVVSDDYGVQNVASALKLKFVPVSQKGISRTLSWKKKCSGCGRDVSGDECPVCGSASKFVSERKK